MTPERWQQVKEVLEAGLALDDAVRGTYLDARCAGDAELREEVDSLLKSNRAAGRHFLDVPALQLRPPDVSAHPGSSADRRIGAYQLLEEIGRGGMGDVYRARRADGQYDLQVAIKVIRSGYEARHLLDRFWTERQILATLDHPNIARLLDGGAAEDGAPYLVMELVQGAGIDAYCDVHKLDITARLMLFQHVCSAVQYAHQHLIVHRDIKPSNILVTPSGVPKLLDFGIAKILGPSRAVEATVNRPMTLAYASPEQTRGEPVTTASDVYSLGVVLYELLSGHSPYRVDARTPMELARAIAEADVVRPSTAILRSKTTYQHDSKLDLMPALVSATREDSAPKLVRRLKGDLDDIVLKALRKEIDQRYASVEQLSNDIQRHLDGLPVSATQGTWNYRARKFLRRHAVGMAAAALVVVACAAGVLATLREARIAAANERRAERRFNDVRQLAGSLLFDVHDSIVDLPGATSARRVLIDRAIRYLDSLSQEAAGDSSLQRELAAAYQRLGNVQGQPRAASLGDSGGALQSYVKALQLRQVIVQGRGANHDDELRLGEMHRVVAEMSHFSGNLSAALEHARLAVGVTSAISDMKPVDPAARATELARDYKTLGEAEWSGMAFGSLADPSAALGHYGKGLAIASAELEREPKNAELTRLREFLRIQVARTLSQNGHQSEAIPDLRVSLLYFRSVAASSSSVRSQRDLATALEMLGNALERDGRFPESLSCFREELTVLTRLSTADAGNLQTRADLLGATADVGVSLMRSGRPNEALSFIRRAIGMIEQLITLDPKRVEYRTWLAVYRVAEGATLTRLHQNQKALASLEAARALYDGVARFDQLDLDERLSVHATDAQIAATLLRLGDVAGARQGYEVAARASELATTADRPRQQAQYTLADSYAGLGDVALRLATAPANRREATARLAEARSWYEKSLRVWRSIQNPGAITPNGFDTEGAAGVERRLVLCSRVRQNVSRTAR